MMDDAWNVERVLNPKPKLTFMDDIYVEKGTRDDWNLLSALHYKAHGLTPGSHYFRLGLNGETIGVIMMASPKLLVKERHMMFPKLKPKPGTDTKVSNHNRMVWVNANMSIVARCVVDTMYRGAGLAYRFVNIASRMEGKRYIEIQSAMSKYNQFAQRGGFKFVPPQRSTKFDIGIQFFRSMFESDPADLEALLLELESLPAGAREKTLAAIRVFYRRHSALESTGKALVRDEDGVRFSDKRVARLEPRELLGQLQQMVLGCPLYGAYENPDAGLILPERIPILAFDNQRTDEPLRLDLLK